jgi:hypothetical protein
VFPFANRRLKLYVVAGTILGTLRVATLLYLCHSSVSHTMSEVKYSFAKVLQPEIFLMTAMSFKVQSNVILYLTLFSLTLMAGSFIVALPLLFVSANRWR